MPAAPDMLADIARTPEWLPFELDPATDQVSLLRLAEEDYRTESFLDQRILSPRSHLRTCSWEELAASVPADARRDANYIFHIGNVGSTLISRLIGELDNVFAYREPLLLRDLALAPPADERFDILSALLSRTFRPSQRANVKATSFASEIAGRLVRPGSRALFLYATPDHYLENILAGHNSGQTLRILTPIRAARLAVRCPGFAVEPSRMHDGLKAALGWACEMSSLDEAASELPRDAVMWLDFDLFLEDPTAHFAAIAAFFGHQVDPAEARVIAEGPLIRSYSKALEHPFSPADRRETLADARRYFGPAIRDALNWLGALESRYAAVARAIRRGRGEA
jgi:hypothetical protein